MSMIIERLLRALRPVLGVLALWFLMVLAMPLTPAFGGRVEVLWPSLQLLRNLPADVTILEASSRRLRLESAQGDLALRLYAAGARLVLPSAGNGCISWR